MQGSACARALVTLAAHHVPCNKCTWVCQLCRYARECMCTCFGHACSPPCALHMHAQQHLQTHAWCTVCFHLMCSSMTRLGVSCSHFAATGMRRGWTAHCAGCCSCHARGLAHATRTHVPHARARPHVRTVSRQAERARGLQRLPNSIQGTTAAGAFSYSWHSPCQVLPAPNFSCKRCASQT